MHDLSVRIVSTLLLSGALLFVTFFILSILYPRKVMGGTACEARTRGLSPGGEGLRVVPCSDRTPARMDAPTDRSPCDPQDWSLKLGLGNCADYFHCELGFTSVPDSGGAQLESDESRAAAY